MIGLHKTVLLTALALIFCGAAAMAQKPKEYKSIAPALKRVIEKNHCSPPVFDNAALQALLREFVNRLDDEHLYFTQADIQQLQAALPEMRDELDGKNHLFLNRVIALYKTRLLKADTAIAAICQKPFVFTAPEQILFATDSSNYAANETELHNWWAKWLKYKTLYRLTNNLLADSTLTTAMVLKQEPAQRELVRKTEQRKIKQVLESPRGYENYVSDLFCGALANRFDPHTEFFPPADRENFVGAVSGESYAFGLQLNQNDKDEIEIVHLAPGSPAWKCGDLNNNDVLLQLQWQGKAKVDLEGADMAEVSSLLGELNHERLSLTVRKANGVQKTVTLVKEKMHDEESFVKSFVLSGEKKLGYILLPGFYTEWETSSGSSCANDVAKEIVKLKKENIEGLILDLRDNGGGSMEEAMQLSGIFVEEGVLGFEKEKTGKPVALKDPNRGTIYDGPMLVMVNGGSASASEVVAGALQDYNRALIAGCPTYGKATMQVVLAVDTTLSLAEAAKGNSTKYDYAKITVGKLYRVNGSSNQLRGVVPDISLPDIAELLNYREQSQPYALPYDTVKRALYFTPLAPLPVKALAEKSNIRVAASDAFKAVRHWQPALAEMYKVPAITLQFDGYLAAKKKMRDQWMAMAAELKKPESSVYTVQNSAPDKQRLAADVYLKEINDATLKSAAEDIYLRESFLILTDYIHTLK